MTKIEIFIRCLALQRGYPFMFATYGPRGEDGLREIFDYMINTPEELEMVIQEVNAERMKID